MAVVMQMTGIDTILKNLDRQDKAIAAAVENGLKRAGDMLLIESNKLVPVQIGKLMASGEVRNVGGKGWKADIAVFYKALYAAVVHENLEAVHGRAFNVKYARQIAAHSRTIKRGARAGQVVYATAKSGWAPRGENQQAKFLETPMRTCREDLLGIVAWEVENATPAK